MTKEKKFKSVPNKLWPLDSVPNYRLIGTIGALVLIGGAALRSVYIQQREELEACVERGMEESFPRSYPQYSNPAQISGDAEGGQYLEIKQAYFSGSAVANPRFTTPSELEEAVWQGRIVRAAVEIGCSERTDR